MAILIRLTNALTIVPSLVESINQKHHLVGVLLEFLLNMVSRHSVALHDSKLDFVGYLVMMPKDAVKNTILSLK